MRESVLSSAGHCCVVCDACSEQDLAVIAEATAKASHSMQGWRPLLVGSAGLAAAIPSAFGLSAAAEPLTTKGWKTAAKAPTVVVSGSSQQTTLDQIEYLQKHEKVSTSAEAACGGVLLVNPVDGKQTSALAVEAASAVLQPGAAVSGVVATGGETAMALLARLNVRSLEVVGEAAPLTPLLRVQGGTWDGLPWVTKSGALGPPSALLAATRAIHASSTGRPTAELPLLGITMGDPCGVGPEIIVKALAQSKPHTVARYVVIGSLACMERGLAAVPGHGLRAQAVAKPEDAVADRSVVSVWSPFQSDISKMPLGQVSDEAGRCATLWVREATRLAVEKRIDGIVTAPLNKEAMYKAGFTQYGGHTEILQEGSGAKSSSLCLYANGLTIAHATCHIPFKDISTNLSPEKIFDTTRILRDFMLMAQPGREPRIVMAGLNPHCEPIFGDEETRCIQPAIDTCRAQGWDVHTRPVPPDTVFLRAKNGDWDAVVAMYHDQGHIPAKIAGFGDTVNVTLGLPIVRTSVDHGTAFDIAGKGIVDEANLLSAIDLGATMADGHRASSAI